VVCLALGAAATSAVATLVGALLLRPLPFPEADRLVRLWFEERDVSSRISLSIPEFDDFGQIPAFDTFVGSAARACRGNTSRSSDCGRHLDDS
jgi:hypothetical protein